MAIHAGDIPIEEVSGRLNSYLSTFESIVATYRSWAELQLDWNCLAAILDRIPKHVAQALKSEITGSATRTVYDAYNAATQYATHRMRSCPGSA